MDRHARISIIIISIALLLHIACSSANRYRVLTFFFDGVPVPGAVPQVGYSREGGDVPIDEVDTKVITPIVALIAHMPFRENRCGKCHNAETGGLFRSVEDGLCLMCHAKPQTQYAYVHGPVAVNACLSCHHHHTSPNKHLLLNDDSTMCFQCHDREDLEEGPHHQEQDARSCTQCHHAHGGDNRFFLKPGQGSGS